MSPPLAIERNVGDNPTHTLIWLHGLGGDGEDFVELGEALKLSQGAAIRFIFPQAPFIPITLNRGLTMRGWYDIIDIHALNRQIDETGLNQSCTSILELISRENSRGIPTSRVLVGGFSQGGAVAYHISLGAPQPLGGVIACSTYLPTSPALLEYRRPANAVTPLFVTHGLHDETVPLEAGLAAIEQMRAWGYAVEWHSYPIGHTMCEAQISALSRWIQRRLAAPTPIREIIQ